MVKDVAPAQIAGDIAIVIVGKAGLDTVLVVLLVPVQPPVVTEKPE